MSAVLLHSMLQNPPNNILNWQTDQSQSRIEFDLFSSPICCWFRLLVRLHYSFVLLPNPLVCVVSLLWSCSSGDPVILASQSPAVSMASVLWQDADPRIAAEAASLVHAHSSEFMHIPMNVHERLLVMTMWGHLCQPDTGACVCVRAWQLTVQRTAQDITGSADQAVQSKQITAV